MKPDGRKASSTLPADTETRVLPASSRTDVHILLPCRIPNRKAGRKARASPPPGLAGTLPAPTHIRQDGRKTARRFEAAVRAGPDEPCSAAQTRRTLVLPLLPECRRGLFRRAEYIPPSRRFPPLFLPLFSTHLFFSSPAKFFGRVLQEKETILKKTAVRFH